MLRQPLALCAIALVAAPASAATYSAKLIQPTTNRFIARDIVWNCGPAACEGATDNGRPLVLCQSLAKRAGRIDSFATDGHVLPAVELERCNASARQSGSRALAARQ